MTTALCFNCGETKFGALCPCGKCGSPPSGEINLDILFSDHRMSVSTLEAFGGIIKTLAKNSNDPEIRFWAFISYLSEHPSQLLSATPPAEVADRVEDLLAKCQLPMVTADLKELAEDTGPPQRTLDVPERLLHAYRQAHELTIIQRIQVRRKDGAVANGVLMEVGEGTAQLMVPAEFEILPEEIVAMRPVPGCLLGWLFKPRWVEAG